MGIIIKMFANEHPEYTPPGWNTVYPEYLKDPRILTSPKDEPFTDSYLYLFPATHIKELAREYAARPDDPASVNEARSTIPILLNKTDFPGPEPGRNVLFLDGHVEYIRTDSDRWRNDILPFIEAAQK